MARNGGGIPLSVACHIYLEQHTGILLTVETIAIRVGQRCPLLRRAHAATASAVFCAVLSLEEPLDE